MLRSLGTGCLHMTSCAGVKFGCPQLAVARVLVVQLATEKPNRTAIFDINMRRDQHFTTCFFVELAGSVK